MPDVSIASGAIIGAVESRTERSRLGAGAAAGGEISPVSGRNLDAVGVGELVAHRYDLLCPLQPEQVG